jgi:hypothetical protein
MITNNIRRYAQVCNVEPQDMVKHLQADSFAREQFEAWKALESRLDAAPISPGMTTEEIQMSDANTKDMAVRASIPQSKDPVFLAWMEQYWPYEFTGNAYAAWMAARASAATKTQVIE